IDAETVMLRASDVQRYAGEVSQAVNMIVRNGLSESDIRFSHPNADSAYGTTFTAPLERQVFHRSGGGAEYRAPPAGINDGTPWQFYGNTHIKGYGTEDSNARKAELLMVLPNVTEAFCTRINELN